jgi:hypothetical protein
LDSVSVRVDDLVKDRRPPKAAALRAVLDKIINTNNQHPSDQGRLLIRRGKFRPSPLVFDASAPMIRPSFSRYQNSSQGEHNGCGSTRS